MCLPIENPPVPTHISGYEMHAHSPSPSSSPSTLSWALGHLRHNHEHHPPVNPPVSLFLPTLLDALCPSIKRTFALGDLLHGLELSVLYKCVSRSAHCIVSTLLAPSFCISIYIYIYIYLHTCILSLHWRRHMHAIRRHFACPCRAEFSILGDGRTEGYWRGN